MINKKGIIGIITDTHIKKNNIKQIEDIFKQFMNVLLKNDIKVAIHLGDWFDNRSHQDMHTLLAIKDILNLFKENEIYLFTIQGNHDKILLDGSFGYMNIFQLSSRKNFVLFSEYGFYDLEKSKIRMHFLPYFIESSRYPEELKKSKRNINSEFKNILFTHISVNGIRNNDGSIVEDGIENKMLKHFDIIFTGHYHERSTICSNVHYIGSSHQANFGESENKGFCILNNDLSFKFFQSNFKRYKKIKVNIDDKDSLKEIYDELKKINLDDYNVRLILMGSINSIESLDVSAFKELGVDVKFENTVETIVDFENIEEKDLVSFSDKEIMKNYIIYSKEYEFTSEQRMEGLKYLKQL